MRLPLILVVLAVAAPARAQPATQLQIDDLRFQLQMAQQRAVAQANEQMALEADLRARQAVTDLQMQRLAPARVPVLPYPLAPAAGAGATVFPSMPDAALAESNRRVQAAAQNRR